MTWEDEDLELARVEAARRRLYRRIAIVVLIALALGLVSFLHTTLPLL